MRRRIRKLPQNFKWVMTEKKMKVCILFIYLFMNRLHRLILAIQATAIAGDLSKSVKCPPKHTNFSFPKDILQGEEKTYLTMMCFKPSVLHSAISINKN